VTPAQISLAARVAKAVGKVGALAMVMKVREVERRLEIFKSF